MASPCSTSSRTSAATSRRPSRRRPDVQPWQFEGAREGPFLLAPRRVLPEVPAQQCVERRVLDLKLDRRDEERFGGNRKELFWSLGGIRVEQRLFAGVGPVAERVVLGAEHAHPLVERGAV